MATRRGREIGYPTANIALDRYLRPRFGVYAVRGRLADGRVLDGAANLGIRPMFDPPKELLEPYFFDFDGDLYGQTIEVELISFIRDEARFDSVEALKAQIAATATKRGGGWRTLTSSREAGIRIAGPPLGSRFAGMTMHWKHQHALTRNAIALRAASGATSSSRSPRRDPVAAQRLLDRAAAAGAADPRRPSRHRPAVRPCGPDRRRLHRHAHPAAGRQSLHREHAPLALHARSAIGARRRRARRPADQRTARWSSSTTADLDCRTNGTRRGRASTRSPICKTLDVGYGYTADGGRTFPFRGRASAACRPSRRCCARCRPRASSSIFKSKDPRDADALVAAFAPRRRGDRRQIWLRRRPGRAARLRQLTRGAWIDRPAASAKACLTDYRKTGWIGIVPASCRNTTVIVPLQLSLDALGLALSLPRPDGEATAASSSGARTRTATSSALDRPEQYDQVPHDFHGWLLVDDFYNVGRRCCGKHCEGCEPAICSACGTNRDGCDFSIDLF